MGKSVKVKYYDPSGKSQDGYIIDNKTYKDPQGTQRVDLGSIVETAGGMYTLTEKGGVKTGGQSQYSKLAEDSILGARANARRAISNALDKQTRIIENNKYRTKKEYEQLIRQIKQKKKLSEKNLAQILEAQGIKGGMSESAIISNNINYENNINDLNTALENELFDYDNALLELQKDAEYNTLMSDAKYDELYSDYLRENAKNEFEDYIAQRNLNSQNFLANRNYEQDKEEFAYKVNSDERDYLRRIFENDREYDLDKTIFDWDKYNDNRNYNLNVRKTDISERKSKK